jgi:hypothetical protein
MEIIRHRVNDSQTLKTTPSNFGVEIDLRSDGKSLFLAHDPFAEGEPFASWLESFSHGTLVVNVKEEGLEEAATLLLKENGISDYFFLDQSAPFLIRRGLSGLKDGACRVSDFESINTARTLRQFCEWVWVDSFFQRSVAELELAELRQLGFKLCLVSPELHDPGRLEEAALLAIDVRNGSDIPDAVCTKYPDLWTFHEA